MEGAHRESCWSGYTGAVFPKMHSWIFPVGGLCITMLASGNLRLFLWGGGNL